jgi:hypothetical protein
MLRDSTVIKGEKHGYMYAHGGLPHMHSGGRGECTCAYTRRGTQRTAISKHWFGNILKWRTNLSHEQGKIHREPKGVVKHECMVAGELQFE